MSNIILHIPHASTIIPHGTTFLVDDQTIREELLKLTDWHTEDLFSAGGHVRIIAPYSRLFCDTERFADDDREVMAEKGMGVLYTTLDDGRLFRHASPALKQSILNQYYWPHHRNLSDAVHSRLQQYGSALIIDGHSYPDEPLQRDLNKQVPRPDVNIGTDPFHTPQELIDVSVKFFEKKGLSLGINWPYQGTMVPAEYYRKNPQVYSIMLEINRKLYLKNGTNEKSDGYDHIKAIVGEFIHEFDDIRKNKMKSNLSLFEEYCREHGIPFRDTTDQMIGKTTLIYSGSPTPDTSDNASCSIRNLNRRKGH